jgi:hypothetical protein
VRRAWTALIIVGAVAVSAAAPATAITPSGNAADLSAALSSQPGLVVGASFAAGPAGANAAGTSTAAGVFFPTDATTFAVLTTGDVANANPPNDAGNKGTDLGITARNVRDLTILKVDVNVPPNANCIGFDFAFYSEEFPEFVGTQFNDAFLAELDTNDWTYDSTARTIAAPNNFAFDEQQRAMTVNTALASTQATDLQYDGSTQLIRARKQVTPGAHSLFFTIYDAGDNIYDSAVFLDNLRAASIPAAQCQPGATRVDSDGDGLLDEWETTGIDTNGDGTVELNLAAMGANPNHKDMFIELDTMPNHTIAQAAINTVVASFAAAPVTNPDGTTGITLHVDNGPASIMNPVTGATWGALSRATATIPETAVLGTFSGPNYNWAAFDVFKAANFPAERAPAFRYAISGHQYGAATNTSSGLARGISGSDFLITLGGFCAVGDCSGTVAQQTGTFMHELGHTLNLRHGGGDNTNRKPNYLSIMNYAFQMSGLTAGGVGGRYDYSRFGPTVLPDLNENTLAEATGFGAVPAPGAPVDVNTFTSIRGCAAAPLWRITPITGAVDWNCSGAATDAGSADINRETAAAPLTVLTSYDDWAGLRIRGGAIGGFGFSLPTETESIEPSKAVLQETAQVMAGDAVKPTIKRVLKRTKKRVGAAKRPKLRRVQVTLTARDNKGLESLIVIVDGKTTTVRAKKGVAVFRKTFIKGRHVLRYSAVDKIGNATKPARLNVAIPK